MLYITHPFYPYKSIDMSRLEQQYIFLTLLLVNIELQFF